MASMRKDIAAYSTIYSSLIHDDVLEPFVRDALTAALNVQPPKGNTP